MTVDISKVNKQHLDFGFIHFRTVKLSLLDVYGMAARQLLWSLDNF